MSETNADPQQEYAAALAAYRDAQARLQEAKRHIPEFPRDRERRRKREERAAKRARYLARTPEQIAAENTMMNKLTAKAMAILHQKVNPEWDNPGAEIGSTLRIRLPVTYRVIGNDDE